jgi:GcrA cell cycle regulator
MSTDNIARADQWTDARVSDLKKLWMEGKSASQISRQLGGVSRNAVIGKVHRIGLAGRDRPTAPRVLGRANRRQFAGAHISSTPRPRPSTPTPSRVPGPELTVTASILSLGGEQCRWPIGDPRDADFGYCGRFRDRHASYCDHHAGVAVAKQSPRRQAAGLDRLIALVGGG